METQVRLDPLTLPTPHWLTPEAPTGLVSFHYSSLCSSDTALERPSLTTRLRLSSTTALDYVIGSYSLYSTNHHLK